MPDLVTFGNWRLLRFCYAVCHRVCIWPQIQFFLHSNKILLRYSLCVECCLLLHFSCHSAKKSSCLLSCQKLRDAEQALSVQPLCASHFCGNNFRGILLVAFLSNAKSSSQILSLLLVKPLSLLYLFQSEAFRWCYISSGSRTGFWRRRNSWHGIWTFFEPAAHLINLRFIKNCLPFNRFYACSELEMPF